MFWRKKINFNTGAHLDTRSEDLKALDYEQKELVASIAPVNWIKKDKYRTFPKRMQNGSGSCVMQGCEKERGIMAFSKYGEFIEFSSNGGYQSRAYPAISGSTVDDLIRSTNQGAVFESISPSFSKTDLQMMSAKKPAYTADLAKIFGAKRVFLDIDIDIIASTIENTGKGVGLTIKFGKGEWFHTYEVTEKLKNPKDWIYGHYVVVVDYTLNKKGEKCLVIEDSACEDGYPQRLVPESFFKARTYWRPSYILNFKNYIEKPDKPSYTGTITNLQDILKYEGFFPVNTDSTGYFGAITKKALIQFQLKYNIEPPEGNFGQITKAKLQELYP